jgi:hypothetical protein
VVSTKFNVTNEPNLIPLHFSMSIGRQRPRGRRLMTPAQSNQDDKAKGQRTHSS